MTRFLLQAFSESAAEDNAMANAGWSGESEITIAPMLTSRCDHHGRASPDSLEEGGVECERRGASVDRRRSVLKRGESATRAAGNERGEAP